MKQGETANTSGKDSERRSFLVRFAAVVCGGIVALFPVAAGWGVLIDPWRRSRRSSTDGGNSSAANFVRICPLDALPADGTPQAFPVVSDIVDAWTRAANQRIGMVYLNRIQGGKEPGVAAFNAECPHLGCFVDFNRVDGHFECPCHNSAFDKDGHKLFGPSLRGLDQLDVKLQAKDGQTDVFVAFEKFQKGIEERKPAE
jgi:nitrite reductase/ring-hydroxylating ferredoxin subunit